MQTVRMIFSVLVLAALTAGAGLAADLAKPGLVFVTASGRGPSGEDQFVIADSADAGAKRLWDRVQSDPNVMRAAAIYQKLQEDRKLQIRDELAADGTLDAQDEAILRDIPGPHPVYIEVAPGTNGAYNNWKAQFALKGEDGTVERVAAPRIVFNANDPVAIGTDLSLFRQTVVHEISHGFHAVMVGPNDTPSTPWLQEPHAGTTTSDGTLALIEGYAEFVAAHLTGRKTIANDPADTIVNNLYAYNSEGKVKDPDSLWKTEGWAATVLYKIANMDGIQDGFDKINRTIATSNPQTFEDLIDELQAQNPGDKALIRSVVSKASFEQIYQGSAGNDGAGGYAQGGGTVNQSGSGTLKTLFTNSEGDSSGTNMGQLLAAVGGGIFGAVFGVSFGPVGIILAGAMGAGLGHVLGGLLFNRDHASESFDGYWPSSASPTSGQEGTATVHAHAPGCGHFHDAPGVAPTPEQAREHLDEAYREYLSALGDSQGVEAAKTRYDGARAAYREALAGER